MVWVNQDGHHEREIKVEFSELYSNVVNIKCY